MELSRKALREITGPAAVAAVAVAVGIKPLSTMRTGQVVHGGIAMLYGIWVILPPRPAAFIIAKPLPASGARLDDGLATVRAAVARF